MSPKYSCPFPSLFVGQMAHSCFTQWMFEGWYFIFWSPSSCVHILCHLLKHCIVFNMSHSYRLLCKTFPLLAVLPLLLNEEKQRFNSKSIRPLLRKSHMWTKGGIPAPVSTEFITDTTFWMGISKSLTVLIVCRNSTSFSFLHYLFFHRPVVQLFMKQPLIYPVKKDIRHEKVLSANENFVTFKPSTIRLLWERDYHPASYSILLFSFYQFKLSFITRRQDKSLRSVTPTVVPALTTTATLKQGFFVQQRSPQFTLFAGEKTERFVAVAQIFALAYSACDVEMLKRLQKRGAGMWEHVHAL